VGNGRVKKSRRVTKGPYRRTEDEVWTVECDDGGGVK
jgi:hypothetical protein